MADGPLEHTTALAALRAVAVELAIQDARIELLGPIADNAVFRLSGGIVARVARSAVRDRAVREVRSGNWLAAQGVPAVRPVETIDQPVTTDGHVVTFWHEVRDASMASTAELARLLRQLHHLPVPSNFEIPMLDPFVRLQEHLADAEPALSGADSRFLAERLDELRHEYAQVSAGLPVCVIHGDANRKNAIRGSDGVAVLLDLERFSVGPREWDLVVSAVYLRLGWYDEREYDAFVGAYGWDIRSWDGFGVLAALREFRMTAWLLSRLVREPRLKDETDRRIASLRHPDAPRSWTPGT
ncbi:Ser/Thr protein kinase RdoA (MazF antagonist) [Kribbella sp. VKM Ac-2527]|uniref:Ser/Thr protein kinase RdoA (MazF antagonist) n=1 Tax=Kribbella caucasensis TaxID=2512215 RepID=A0A4R6KT03_9ACTN|nr:phosphotransferase [Kribbella sp. VKM Ac-2527]TDO54963.1 Ser/Thr protein kinase RdoA (MazF antagonist) [Kribbella sp. VKM Ac-2527]